MLHVDSVREDKKTTSVEIGNFFLRHCWLRLVEIWSGGFLDKYY